MTEEELQRLAASVDELKRAVKRNNPELRAMLAGKGWIILSLLAGLAIAAFCLPAQILVVAFGSFGAIPPAYRTAIWSVLALIIVLAAAWKVILLTRKAAEIDGRAGLASVIGVFFTGRSFSVGVPFIICILVLSGFSVWVGHPWYVLSAIAIPTCFYANYFATMVDRSEFKAAGWWCLVSGLAGLFFLEASPFIWLFVIYGGLCFVYAGALALSERRGAGEEHERAGGR